MNQEEYDAFYNELIQAKCAHLHEFEQDPKVFEGCMPVEEMARRGKETLLLDRSNQSVSNSKVKDRQQ